jgi:hypothetical protein
MDGGSILVVTGAASAPLSARTLTRTGASKRGVTGCRWLAPPAARRARRAPEGQRLRSMTHSRATRGVPGNDVPAGTFLLRILLA